jgi:hypothetical protein
MAVVGKTVVRLQTTRGHINLPADINGDGTITLSFLPGPKSALTPPTLTIGPSGASAGGGGFTNPMTALDDVIIGGAAGAAARLAKGANGTYLGINGSGHLAYGTPAGTGLANPMSAQDDLIIGGASGAGARLAKGSDGQVLTVDPTTHHLVWATPSGGGGSRDSASAVFTTPPDSNNWDQFNEGFGTGTTEQNARGDVSVLVLANDVQPRGLYRQLSTPYVATMAVSLDYPFDGNHSGGVGFYDTVSHKLEIFALTDISNNHAIQGTYFTDPANWASNFTTYIPTVIPNPLWFRLSDDGSFRTTEFSLNGLDWRQLYISASSEFLTADSVCFVALGQNSRCTISSYVEA